MAVRACADCILATESNDTPCDLCGGRGFVPTGIVRQAEHLVIVHGRPFMEFQKFDLRQLCPICGGTGKRKNHPRTLTMERPSLA